MKCNTPIPIIKHEKNHAVGVEKQTPTYDSSLNGLAGLIKEGIIKQMHILPTNSPIPAKNGINVF